MGAFRVGDPGIQVAVSGGLWEDFLDVVEEGSSCRVVWSTPGSFVGGPGRECRNDGGFGVVSDDFPDEGELSFEHDVFNGGDVVE